MIEKSITHIKLTIVLGFMMILISVLSFSIFTKEVLDTTQLAKKQINSLIHELGEVKEKNRVLAEMVNRNPNEKASEIVTLKSAPAQITSDGNDLDFLIVGHNNGLTDTIILAIVNSELKTISFVSIPRDLYIDGRKINEFFEFYGIEKLIEEVSKVTGIEAEKHAIIDMNGFKKFIDAIGGIDVTVEKDIYDSQFPGGPGYYESYSIKKGDYRFSGEEALKYARSRKSTSDFDRNKRQQIILKAVNSQIKKSDYLNNLTNLIALYNTMMQDVVTDVDVLENFTYLKKYQDYEFEVGNGLSTQNYLYPLINESGAYILLPKGGNYEEIKSYINKLIEE